MLYPLRYMRGGFGKVSLVFTQERLMVQLDQNLLLDSTQSVETQAVLVL